MSARYGFRFRSGEPISNSIRRGGAGGAGAFFALGGSAALVGDYVVHVFTFSTTFQVLAGEKSNVEIFCVGGGSSQTASGGGGGTGYTSGVTVSEGSYTVTVGGTGSASSFALGGTTLVSAAGGTGSTSGNGYTIGSTGGGTYYGGYNYGFGGSGGGGGAGGNGGNGSSATWVNVYDGIGGRGGNGGPGVVHSWSGSNVTYGRGGAGGPGSGNTGSNNGPGSDGGAVANSGNAVYGQAGMSGIVILRYLL